MTVIRAMLNGQSETCDKKRRANSVDMREDEKPDRNWRRSGGLVFAAFFFYGTE